MPSAAPPTAISPRFLLVLAFFLICGLALHRQWTASPVFVIAFVVSGWIVTLCLHEGAHALTAYYGGDHTVAQKGYLTLDPLVYSHPLLTFGLPLLYLFIGGIGLPGAAVSINTRLLHSRGWDSAVSAAGPAANALCLGLATLPFALGDPDSGGGAAFWGALAFLGWLQITSILLNLLPIPGLDGFGIIAPFLPGGARAAARGAAAGLGFVLLVLMMTPQFGSTVSRVSNRIADSIGLDRDYAQLGYNLFRFRA